MIFGKKLDISSAKNDRDAIRMIANHIRYMQEQIEMKEKQRQTKAKNTDTNEEVNEE